MQSCDRQLQLTAYHDGELTSGERETIESHLASCPACAAELASLRGLSGRLTGLRTPAMNADALARLHVLAQDSAEAAQRDAMSLDRWSADTGALRFVRALAAVAASVLVTATVGVFVLSADNSGQNLVAASRSSATAPSAGSTGIAGQTTSATPTGWEQLAVSPQAGAEPSQASPTIETAEWIVSGLSGSGRN